MKKSTSIYIEIELIELAKQKNINISQVCEEYLINLVNKKDETDEDKLKEEIKKKKIEKAVLETDIQTAETKIKEIKKKKEDDEYQKEIDRTRKLAEKMAMERGAY